MARLQVAHLLIGGKGALAGLLQLGAQLAQLPLAFAYLGGEHLEQSAGTALHRGGGGLLPRASQVLVLAGAGCAVSGLSLAHGALGGGQALDVAGALVLNVQRGVLQGLGLGTGAGVFGGGHAGCLGGLSLVFDRCLRGGAGAGHGGFGIVQGGAGEGHGALGLTVGGGQFQGAHALGRVEQAVAGVLDSARIKDAPENVPTGGFTIGGLGVFGALGGFGVRGIFGGQQAQGGLGRLGAQGEEGSGQALAQGGAHTCQSVLIDAAQRGGLFAQGFDDLEGRAHAQLGQALRVELGKRNSGGLLE